MNKTKKHISNKWFRVLLAFRYLISKINKRNQIIIFLTISFCLSVNICRSQYPSSNNKTKSTANSNFTKLFDFNETNNGRTPDEIFVSGNFLYGITSYGGPDGDNGILYKIKTDGTKFTNFGLTLGLPFSLTNIDTMLYCTEHKNGHIHSVSTNGNGYIKVYAFDDYYYPTHYISTDRNFIYGIKYDSRGRDASSYMFKLKPDGTEYQEFQSVGDFATGKLLIEDGNIFGTSRGSINVPGSNNFGTVYNINTDGTGFKELYRFTNALEGDSPACLIIIGSELYGSTSMGGKNDCGIIFKINKDGTNFKVIHNCSYEEGAYGCKFVYSGNSLYGITGVGGSFDKGILFKINLDGSEFEKLYDFDDDDGSPWDLVISGDTIWGVTWDGGLYNDGTIFRYIIDEPQIMPVEPPKIITLSIIKPEEIILETKKGLITENGNLIDLDTTFTVEGNIPYTHSWYVKSGNNFVETDNKVDINQDNTFYLFVTTEQGCAYTDSVTVQAKNVTGIDDSFSSENQIKIYPNPNPGIFQVDISDGNANYEYDIIDISGRKVANGNIYCKTTECIQYIKLDNIKPGTYHLIIRKGNIFYGQKKLVIISL